MTDRTPPEQEPPLPADGLDQLLADLVTELDLCAQARWDNPVVFAWRARRCLEVVLLGILTKHSPQSVASLRNPTVDTYVRHEKLKRETPSSPISKDIFNVVDIVHGFGNTATHYQLEFVDHEENAVDVARGLSRIVAWFYGFLNVPMPHETLRLLDAMRDRSHRVTSASQRAIEELRRETDARKAEYTKWEYTLRQERDEARARLADQERALQETHTQAAALAQARNEAHARIDLLERRLHEAQAPRTSAAPTASGPVSRVVTLAAAVVGLITGIGLALTLRGAPAPLVGTTPPDATGAPPHAEGPRAADATTLPLTIVTLDAAGAQMDATAAPTPTCPVGFVLYNAREVALQPWPEGARRWGTALHPGRTTHYPVAPFCLEQHAETVGEVRRFRPALLAATSGCVRLSGGEAQRVTCVLHQEAEAYCADRWQGRLPTVAEWEAAARAVEGAAAVEVQRWRRTVGDMADTRRDQSELEWVADGFPAAPFDLGPAHAGEWMTRAPIPPEPWLGAYPRHSWNRHDEGRDMYIGFRCAVAPR